MIGYKGFKFVITILVSTQQDSDSIFGGFESQSTAYLICKFGLAFFSKSGPSHQSWRFVLAITLLLQQFQIIIRSCNLILH
jgi:hypothetical protein